jgi:hypothetical protein
MINENDLEDVYVVGQTPRDQTSDYSEGSDLDQDKRRRALPISDSVSDSADLRRVMDPVYSEASKTPPEDSTVTPASSNVQIRSGNSNTGTIPYNDVSSRTQNHSGNTPVAKKITKVSKPSDIFLAISTAFLSTLPAISLEDIKFKGSQQIL